VRAGFWVTLTALALTAAGGAGGATIKLGQGIGSWELGQKFERRPGLLRIVRYPDNDGPGCDFGPRTASRIDYYLGGVRLSWRGSGTRKSLYLIDAATTREGDRSGDGFVIGRATLGRVRLAHPRAALTFPEPAPFRLGRAALTLIRKTGAETWDSYVYWFDAGGRLVALQTGSSGC
jgi:hypothetical protein